jgi:carbamoylphosphate synthase large subunit
MCVGVVLAIGRTFPLVIQKALSMIYIGVLGFDPGDFVLAYLVV